MKSSNRKTASWIFPLLVGLIILGNFNQALRAQVAEKAEEIQPLQPGDEIPDIEVRSLDGAPVSISEVISQQPTILVFYRGGWCPYCNQHLAELAELEDELLEAGYQIIAVSPDSPENLRKTLDKNSIKYTLLSDSNADLIKAMGIAYEASFLFEQFRSKGATGAKLDVMPVASLFVVGQNGVIKYAHANPDYKVRMSKEQILELIPRMSR